ncbi:MULTISPECIES: glycine cleavage system protein GcvH [Pseudonocardia]|uniref:Glycine cleavage system H protein n=2 Tax=Pseudonocardia TaxID=1847 RepID=A0A1Y2N8Y1_PSEAH|nr:MULTISPECIES: glycine cleavage system protein GcvH [Pseudonocardia]OSY43920.1 Glycine cleavage system H protein [Pseudonocardia autotrophica]TDN74347.1 glycine cleavage system H protein [Pseudonocardia autotrophica]BBG05111.1 glycine cleavage system H protein [Pseudonocardia autotrophica]GEC27906.1 glycine cleavage system H protein [Pseudonocardia saturnea]
MSVPDDLRYTEQHEWVRVEGGTVTVGITAHAAEALGDVVFVQLPTAGDAVTAGEACGEIESTKSVSDLFAPLDGTVTAVNDALDDAPETAGEDPYGSGWLFRVEPGDAGVPELLTAAEYRSLTEEKSA